MGAEPGRRSLKMPAEKLGPVIVASSLHSIFPKCMISCIVDFDGRVTRVVDGDTHQGLLGSCVKFGHTVVVVLKNPFHN